MVKVTHIVTAGELLDEHVVPDIECLDLVYLLSGLAGGFSRFRGRARDRARYVSGPWWNVGIWRRWWFRGRVR